MTKFLLVEDHEVMRETLAALLSREEDFEVIGKTTTGEEALAFLDDVEPDLILIDLSLPGMSGLALLRRVRERFPDIMCCILSSHAESIYGEYARREGAVAYMDKRRVREIIPTIRVVLAKNSGSVDN